MEFIRRGFVSVGGERERREFCRSERGVSNVWAGVRRVPGVGCVWFRESFRARGVRFVRSGSWMVRVVRVCVEQKKELFDTSRVNSVH